MQVLFAPRCSECSAFKFNLQELAGKRNGMICFVYDRNAKDEIPHEILQNPRFRFVFEADREIIKTEYEPLLPMQIELDSKGIVTSSQLIGRS